MNANGSQTIRCEVTKRYYSVFNVEQCEGLEYLMPATVHHDIQPIEACERLVADMSHAPVITHGGSQAYYRPSEDRITMPQRGLSPAQVVSRLPAQDARYRQGEAGLQAILREVR